MLFSIFTLLELEIKNFEIFTYYCYCYAWTFQIFVAFVYCIFTRKFLPRKSYNNNTDSHFMLKQLNLYFIGVIVIYMLEIYLEDIYWTKFEKFLTSRFCNSFIYGHYLRAKHHKFYLSAANTRSRLALLGIL